MKLRPFFTFYGGKWRAAPYYQPPAYPQIVEPFAGSAGYALRYPDRKVTLIERDPYIAATWRYLLRVAPAEILSLPNVQIGESVDDLAVCPEARLLIGWWLNGGSAQPKKTHSGWARSLAQNGGPGWESGGGQLVWGDRVKLRIASQLGSIRHWRLVEGDYTDAPSVAATWFIDPPYQIAGRHYRFGSKIIDYEALGVWCRGRLGQTIVCENVGANWLPFSAWREIKASSAKHGGKISREAVWLQNRTL